MSFRPRTALVTRLVVSLILAGALFPVAPAPTAATGGSTFVALANGYRADASVAPVGLHAFVDQVAVERARQMAADREMKHDFDYIKNRLAQGGVCWERLGEIIAWNTSGSYERFLGQWYDSDPHREIMLEGRYTAAGGSRDEGSNGRHYAVMIFIRPCGGGTPPPAGSSSPTGFSDVASSPFRADIEWLVSEGITAGCSAHRFCPKGLVTRAQMASFLARALDLPAASRDHFTDDGGSMHQADINRVAAAGISSGCSATRFCPNAGVTRAEMASFLSRALGLPASSRDWFTDDRWSMHHPSINRVAQASITGGCAATRYCPSGYVTRGQMAAFLHRALG
ncbi:MAG: S-layer homology domain-containing protein [Candidatus Limnocylindria bacterium]